MIKIRFLGAAGQVTGSCFLVSAGREKVLVDCGLFQGGKSTFMLNYEPFRFNMDDISGVILTHAHNDHCGRLPLLRKQGFGGVIYAHAATCRLAEIILVDSGHIQEVEARWRTRKNLRRGDPGVEPLYTVEDAKNVLKLFRPQRYHQPVKISDRISFTLHDAGHILGSSIVELRVTRKDGSVATIVLSGDLGRKNQPFIKNPETLSGADYLVMESTYGGRVHKEIEASKEELAGIIREAAQTGGNIIIPAFALGRAQEIIYYIRELYKEGRLPLPYREIYLDSPMATKVTEVYDSALRECYNTEAIETLEEARSLMRFEGLRFVSSVEESMRLNMRNEGLIIISASGMLDAGRILHHLKHNLWNENSHIVITGFQAKGTKGRKLVDGAKIIKIMREEIVVKAKIHTINALSAHANSDGLVAWASAFSKKSPRLTMLVHGEAEQSKMLKNRLSDELGRKCTIPSLGEEITLI